MTLPKSPESLNFRAVNHATFHACILGFCFVLPLKELIKVLIFHVESLRALELSFLMLVEVIWWQNFTL